MGGREKKKLAGDDLLAALEDACRGLVYISETDSEIVPILAAGPGGSSFEEFLGKRAWIKDGPVDDKQAAEFFQRLTKDQEWHGTAERKRVRRLRKLEKMILDNLEDVTMIRAGRIRIDIFVIGRDDAGNIAGIRTRAVET